jgi:hypothetical protein
MPGVWTVSTPQFHRSENLRSEHRIPVLLVEWRHEPRRSQDIFERLYSAVMERLNAHDPLGVMSHGAPANEYAPEAQDFAKLIAAGESITPELTATVWHKWFGEPSEEPEPPTAGMTALAADLQAIKQRFVK